MTTRNHDNTTRTTFAPDRDAVVRLMARRSLCTLATSSAANRPHVAAVVYAAVDTTLYVSTDRSSRKGRNIAENPHVAVCIPVRRLPLGPPATLQFQARAEILAADDPEIRRLHAAGRLKAVTSHGELDNPDGCFVRITPARRISTYAIGMSMLRVLRDPLNAAGSVELAG